MAVVRLAACVDLSEGASASRVDRAAGVIKGVKLLGWSSQNGRTYDPDGVDPRLYEGRAVNFNHHRGAGDRSVYDRFGRVVNVRKAADGLYGDLEYLRSHPYAESVAEAAERMPNVYGLSHTARGVERPGGVKGGNRIERVESVQSVDLVGDPATVSGLYESRGGNVRLTVKQLQEKLSQSRPGYARALREMAEAGIMAPADEMPEPEEMDEPDEADDHKKAILDACKACLDDGSLSEDEKVAKIKKLLAVHKGDAGTAGGSGVTGKAGEGSEGYSAAESRKLADRLNLLEARERLRAAADEAAVRLPKSLIEHVSPSITEAGAKALVAELKAASKAEAARPKSAPARAVTESRGGTGSGDPDPKAIARRVLVG